MTPKQFAPILTRDGHCPCGCGCPADQLVPQHRANRGHGGYKAANRPSNIIALCSRTNGLIESSSRAADQARIYGWKISKWADPTEIPVTDRVTGKQYLLDDNYGRTHV